MQDNKIWQNIFHLRNLRISIQCTLNPSVNANDKTLKKKINKILCINWTHKKKLKML